MNENTENSPSDTTVPVGQVSDPDTPSAVSPEYKAARLRVNMLKGFYLHALIYTAVNSLLLLIDVLTGSTLWFYWSVLGWGIGLAAHAGIVWGRPKLEAWDEQMIKREMGR